MGKIRVKTLGVEEQEKQQKKEAKKRQEAKKTAKASGLKGGQRVVVVGSTEEELSQTEPATEVQKEEKPKKETRLANETKQAVKKTVSKRVRSKRYQAASALIDKTKKYSLSEALTLLPKLQLSSFDESVELHINTTESLSGTVTLPHGTGKKIKVAIADDKLIAEIEKGKIEFDVLLAEPSMMPKLAKVAKILGPRGFMPNPKNGTITTTPQETIKKFESGQIRFKTETQAPIIHLVVGKLSFGQKKLAENIKVITDAVQKQRIKNLTLKSTMSPGVKLDISTG